MQGIHWSRRKYDEATFREVWDTSSTLTEVSRRLGYPSGLGSGYTRIIKDTATILGLSAEHMEISSQRAASGKTIPLEEILVKGSVISSVRLRKKLLKARLLVPKCYECGISEWRGTTAPLDLDHIDGDRYNNQLDNLRLLCKNCHALTTTYGSKNRGRWSNYRPKEPIECSICGCVTKYGEKCLTCYNQTRATKIDWPSKSYLKQRAEEIGFSALGRELGVSDNAVRKRLKNPNCD